MSNNAATAVELMELLPEADQLFAIEFLKKLVLPYQNEIPSQETLRAMQNVKNGVSVISSPIG